MGKKGMLPYEVDGVKKDFCFDLFKTAFDTRCKRGKEPCTKAQLEERLAEAVHVEPATVHNWRCRRNSPASLELVDGVAAFLGVKVDDLLMSHREGNMEKLTESQRKAIASVYREIEDYLYLFVHTNGFVWPDQRVMDGGPYAKYVTAYTDSSFYTKNDCERLVGFIDEDARQRMIYEATRGKVFDEGADLAEAGYAWVCHSLEREWVELGSHPIYDELLEYMVEALADVWGGKTDLDYRMHINDVELSEEYEAAMALKGVQEIIAKYL